MRTPTVFTSFDLASKQQMQPLNVSCSIGAVGTFLYHCPGPAASCHRAGHCGRKAAKFTKDESAVESYQVIALAMRNKITHDKTSAVFRSGAHHVLELNSGSREN